MKYILIPILYILCLSEIAAQDQYKNENYKYFNEVGAGIGVAIFHDNSRQISLEAVKFIKPYTGIRTGIINYSEMSHSKWGFKVPILLAFRTANIDPDSDSDNNCHCCDQDFMSEFINILSSVLPVRYEFNIGPAIGYLYPNRENKRLNSEEKRLYEDYFLDKRVLVTLDANVKASYAIDRVNIGVSGGVSFLATRNYKYYSLNNYPGKRDGKIARWMGNVSFNASYRF